MLLLLLLLLLLLIVHIEYSKVNVKLSDSQIKRLKDAVKDNTGTTLRISLKMFNGNDLPHELLLTRRQKKSWEMLLIIIF